MDYYIQPWHLYSHSRTCTRSGCVKDLLDWWQLLYATSLIMPFFMIFQLSWLDSSVCKISSAIMEILIYLYYTWWWPHMSYFVSCLFMAIIPLCIRDCCMYLQSCAEFDYCIILWMAGSSTWFFITPLLGWTYNVFQPSYHPFDLTH